MWHGSRVPIIRAARSNSRWVVVASWWQGSGIRSGPDPAVGPLSRSWSAAASRAARTPGSRDHAAARAGSPTTRARPLARIRGYSTGGHYTLGNWLPSPVPTGPVRRGQELAWSVYRGCGRPAYRSRHRSRDRVRRARRDPFRLQWPASPAEGCGRTGTGWWTCPCADSILPPGRPWRAWSRRAAGRRRRSPVSAAATGPPGPRSGSAVPPTAVLTPSQPHRDHTDPGPYSGVPDRGRLLNRR